MNARAGTNPARAFLPQPNLPDEQIHIHVLPGRAGIGLGFDLALCRRLEHRLDLRTGAERRLLKNVDLAGQQCCHCRIGVGVELDDDC